MIDKKNLISYLFLAMLLAVISAYSGFLWQGRISEYVFLISALCFFGLLSQLLYQFFTLEQLKLFLWATNIVVALVLAYYSLSVVYFLIPLAIILLSFIPRNKDAFFSINFWANFFASICFLYIIIEISQPSLIDIYFYLIIVFNSLISLASYLVKSYYELEHPGKKAAVSYFILKVPRYYIFIMLLIPLTLILGGILALDETLLSILIVIIGLIFLLIFNHVFTDLIIDRNNLILKKSLFPSQQSINLKNVQKAVIKRVNGMYYIPVQILELHFKDSVKRIDIRTNYNYKNTMKFIKVLKNVLGKKLLSEK